MKKITEKISYVGVDDKTLDLFESQYIIPNGVSYNSYIIKDEKITINGWIPGNFYGTFKGDMTIKEAIKYNCNTNLIINCYNL